MKELSDEILNKYIDNELSTTKINELKEYIQNHPEELKKFKAHNLIDNLLREMAHESAPSNFTEKLMEKITPAILYKPDNGHFLKIVLSVFGLFIAGFTIAGLIIPSEQSTDKSLLPGGIEKATQWAKANLPSLFDSLGNYNILVFFSVFVLLALISMYVFVNSHKHFKKELENISH